MAFEGLRETLKNQFADLMSKIQELPAYNTAREQFEAQSPTAQKAILGGLAFFAFIIVMSLPWGYISTSQDNMAAFTENRGLITGLLKASRLSKEPSPLPPPQGVEVLKSQVQNVVQELRLIPEQVGEIVPNPEPRPAKDMAPTVVIQTGLNVQLKKLNLKQVVALSHRFQELGAGTKLMGLSIVQSAGTTHYYDIVATVVNFALPAPAVIEDHPEPKRGAGGKKPPKRKSDEESPE